MTAVDQEPEALPSSSHHPQRIAIPSRHVRRARRRRPPSLNAFALGTVVVLALIAIVVVASCSEPPVGPSAAPRTALDRLAPCSAATASRARCLVGGQQVVVSAAGMPLLLGGLQVRASRSASRRAGELRLKVRLRNVARSTSSVPARRFGLLVGSRRLVPRLAGEFSLGSGEAVTRTLRFRLQRGDAEALRAPLRRALLAVDASDGSRAGAVEIRSAAASLSAR